MTTTTRKIRIPDWFHRHGKKILVLTLIAATLFGLFAAVEWGHMLDNTAENTRNRMLGIWSNIEDFGGWFFGKDVDVDFTVPPFVLAAALVTLLALWYIVKLIIKSVYGLISGVCQWVWKKIPVKGQNTIQTVAKWLLLTVLGLIALAAAAIFGATKLADYRGTVYNRLDIAGNETVDFIAQWWMFGVAGLLLLGGLYGLYRAFKAWPGLTSIVTGIALVLAFVAGVTVMTLNGNDSPKQPAAIEEPLANPTTGAATATPAPDKTTAAPAASAPVTGPTTDVETTAPAEEETTAQATGLTKADLAQVRSDMQQTMLWGFGFMLVLMVAGMFLVYAIAKRRFEPRYTYPIHVSGPPAP